MTEQSSFEVNLKFEKSKKWSKIRKSVFFKLHFVAPSKNVGQDPYLIRCLSKVIKNGVKIHSK